MSDWWLAYWISHSYDHPGSLLNTTTDSLSLYSTLLTDSSSSSSSSSYMYDGVLLVGSGSGSAENSTVLREASDSLPFYLGVYGGLAAANSVRSRSHSLVHYRFNPFCTHYCIIGLTLSTLISAL